MSSQTGIDVHVQKEWRFQDRIVRSMHSYKAFGSSDFILIRSLNDLNDITITKIFEGKGEHNKVKNSIFDL